jgi:hypothetical protein
MKDSDYIIHNLISIFWTQAMKQDENLIERGIPIDIQFNFAKALYKMCDELDELRSEVEELKCRE